MGAGITGPGSGITSHGIEFSGVLRDQGSRCAISVGSGAKICHSSGIKD